ncbi:MAG: hypothetical protein ABI082_02110 [Dokdonella sp.]
MKLFHLSALVAFTCILTACSSEPVRKVHPSTASIQQLAVQADGSWKITLRIQNFSTMSMHYSAFDAKFQVAGVDAGQITLTPDLDIVGNSGDVIEATLRPSTKIPVSGNFAYQLTGTINTSEPRAQFKIDVSSRLSPVPGVPHTFR